MASFDTVSLVDMQEVDNAVNNVKKEVQNRYDFRGSDTTVELDKKQELVHIATTDDMKMNALREIIISQFVKRGVDIRSLDWKDVEKAGGQKLKRIINLKKGIDKENAKNITAIIKQSGLKVQSAIMDDRVRITGKKIDDLQAAIKLLKENGPNIALQFINMKS